MAVRHADFSSQSGDDYAKDPVRKRGEHSPCVDGGRALWDLRADSQEMTQAR